MIVVDANVIGKLILEEGDSDVARAFVAAVATGGHRICAPTLLKLEVFAIALHHGIDFDIPAALLQHLEDAVLTLVEPSPLLWQRAYEMARSGHPKSGHPSLQDSLYHCLAIEIGGTFLTADRRHVAKTAALGHVALLPDWVTHLGD